MTPEEVRILAWTLLGEAAGEGQLGMTAVAHVIRNRAESGRFPSNPAAVAIQNNGRGTYQFSTWNDASNGGNSPRSRYPLTSEEYKRAEQIVKTVFGPTPGNDPTQGATHYYSPKGMPGGNAPYWWSSEAKHGSVKIGDHVFATKQQGPIAGFPTAASERPGNNITPVENKPVNFADVQVIRTGRSVGLPDLNAGAPFVYDPVQHKMVAKETPAAAIIATAGSAKQAQTQLAMSYAGQERAKPVQLGLTEGETWTTVATISTKPQASNDDDIDWTKVPVGPTVAVIPTTTSPKGSSSQNIRDQRAEQQVVRRITTPAVSTTKVNGTAPKTQVVAGFAVPGGVDGIKQVDAARGKEKTQAKPAVPAAKGSTSTTKGQERLSPSGGLNPVMQSGGLSRDAVAARAAGQAVAAKMAGKVGVEVVAAPKAAIPPLPRPRPVVESPSKPVTKVIVQGGNYSGGGSTSAPVQYVTTQTGKTAVAGSTYQGTDGYTYRVESNGTITNTKSGSNSGTWYNPDTNRFEKR